MTFNKGRGGTVKKSHCMSSAIICVFLQRWLQVLQKKHKSVLSWFSWQVVSRPLEQIPKCSASWARVIFHFEITASKCDQDFHGYEISLKAFFGSKAIHCFIILPNSHNISFNPLMKYLFAILELEEISGRRYIFPLVFAPSMTYMNNKIWQQNSKLEFLE